MNQSDRPYLEVVYSTEAATSTVYFLKDHLGSIRATVLDSATAPVRGYDDYDPWGYILAGRSMLTSGWSSNAGIVKNKFTGKEWDDDYSLNWNYFGARYYDPQIGRWMSVDPLALKHPDATPYNYVLNNPMILIDPDGKQIRARIAYTPPPSLKQIEQNLSRSFNEAKIFASAGLMEYAVGRLTLGLVEAAASGLANLDPFNISGLVNPIAATVGFADDAILFGQKGISQIFRHGEFAGMAIDDVVVGLKSGAIKADQLPIMVINREGVTYTLNNRSLMALRQAGLEPTVIKDVTGVAKYESLLTQRLSEIGSEVGPDFVPIIRGK